MEYNSHIDRSFISTILQLPHDVFNYTKIELLRVDLISASAALIVFVLNNTTRSRWIPFSQLRKDGNNDVWMSNWLLNKIKLDNIND
jgi:hypothetical protein